MTPSSTLIAFRDATTNQLAVLPAGDLTNFEKHNAEIIADLAPASATERMLAASIAWDSWRIDRLRALETNILSIASPPPEVVVECLEPGAKLAIATAAAFEIQARQLQVITQCQERIARGMHKNLAVLQAMKTRITARGSAGSRQNGFVFSNRKTGAAG